MKPEPDSSTLRYVVAHMMGTLPTPDFEVLCSLAAEDLTGTGRIRGKTAADIALDRNRSVRWVEKQLTRMVKAGTHLRRTGWTYIIVGAAEHDEKICGHGACIKIAEKARREAAADELAALRRQKDKERKRLAREARRAPTVDERAAPF